MEVVEVVVLLLIMGKARAEPARAARTNEIEACIFGIDERLDSGKDAYDRSWIRSDCGKETGKEK
jgi:hypothetical protein